MATTSKYRSRRTVGRDARRRAAGRRTPKPTTSPKTRRVLVATDGSEPSNAALRLARLYADRGEWAPHIVTVSEPIPAYVGDMGMPLPNPDMELLVENGVKTRIGKQVRRFGSDAWNFEVQFGRTPPTIVRAASKRNAELIVLGLGKHRAIARLFGAETAARVARNADVPVLAVHPQTKRLPRTAVVATDFGAASLRAAREALRLLDTPGRLHLVHVKWGVNLTTLSDEDWMLAYEAGAQQGLARFIAKLDQRDGIEITTELVTGVLSKALENAAKSAKADLIAIGRHSEGVIDRMVIGSTPAHILRTAECSVLVAPETNPA